MIPFRLTELTRCTNPVKIYEYLAAGKPVVATALPEVQLMSDVVHVADSHKSFMGLLETAMGERRDAALAARRRQSAKPHDWKNRADRLDTAIRSAFPKVSVVVLTYNNLRFTKACLKSLELNTRYPDWELVLVDNASTDGSRDYLAEYALGKPWVKLVQNDENLGFAAGNNRGLEAATGEYLVVLNNDTYVTRGWLLDLVRHLRKDPRLGLIGAVTNNIGNEAKIDIHYEDMAGMQQAAYAYTKRHAREELDVRVVAFFCTAMPRSLFETVGGLDERFGLGFSRTMTTAGGPRRKDTESPWPKTCSCTITCPPRSTRLTAGNGRRCSIATRRSTRKSGALGHLTDTAINNEWLIRF